MVSTRFLILAEEIDGSNISTEKSGVGSYSARNSPGFVAESSQLVLARFAFKSRLVVATKGSKISIEGFDPGLESVNKPGACSALVSTRDGPNVKRVSSAEEHSESKNSSR